MLLNFCMAWETLTGEINNDPKISRLTLLFVTYTTYSTVTAVHGNAKSQTQCYADNSCNEGKFSTGPLWSQHFCLTVPI